jgi:hypothetical protein
MKAFGFFSAGVFALLIALSCGVVAQEKQDAPKQEPAKQEQPKPAATGPVFSGQIFTNYMYELDGSDGPNCNKFDIERLYLTAKANLAEDWKIQVTTDIYRNAGTGSYYNGLAVRLKFGYVEYTPVSSLSIKMGMVPGPWAGLVETLWRYRGVVTTASDRYSYVSTADLGLSACYSLPEKTGEVAAYVLNGDGYSNVESNRFKDFVFRANVAPFSSVDALKGLMFGGLAYIGKTGTTTMLTKNRFGGLVGYQYSVATVGVEYLVRKDTPTNPDTTVTGNVVSIFGELKAPFADLEKKLSLIGRFDVQEPNTVKGGDVARFLVLGVTWKANDKVTFAVDHQRVRMERETLKRSDGKYVSRDKRWYLHAIVSF